VNDYKNYLLDKTIENKLTCFVSGFNPCLLRRFSMQEYLDFEAQAFMPGRMSPILKADLSYYLWIITSNYSGVPIWDNIYVGISVFPEEIFIIKYL